MKSKNRDIYSGLFFLAFSILLYVLSNHISVNVISEFGGKIMPKAISIILMLLSLSLIIGELFHKEQKEVSEKTDDDLSRLPVWKQFLPLAILILVTFGYVAVLKRVGFLISTSIAMFLIIFVLSGYRKNKTWLYAVISIVFTAAVYFSFLRFFNLMLPRGILG